MSAVALDPVFVIDDDSAARESIAGLVRSHGLQVETYASAEEFFDRFDRAGHGCLVTDVMLRGMSGIQLLERLTTEGIELPVIVLTSHGDVPTAVRAMQRGATTFLEKPCNHLRLWEAICAAQRRESEVRVLRLQRAETRRRLAALTPDESRVLERLLEGKPNKTIAKDLDLGLRTVELRRANILQKMQAASLPELVRMVVLVREERPSAGSGDHSTA